MPDGWFAGASLNLTTIDLSNNTLTGYLPKSWSSLINLQYLDLSSNLLLGELPAEWGSMRRLTTL